MSSLISTSQAPLLLFALRPRSLQIQHWQGPRSLTIIVCGKGFFCFGRLVTLCGCYALGFANCPDLLYLNLWIHVQLSHVLQNQRGASVSPTQTQQKLKGNTLLPPWKKNLHNLCTVHNTTTTHEIAILHWILLV